MSRLGTVRPDHETLWRAHGTELARFATLLVGPADAADLVSVAFLKVAGAPSTPEHPRAYLFRAVLNAALDQRRSRRRRQARELNAALPTMDTHAAGDLDVRRAVAALSVRQRAVVYFTYWEDLDDQHIAVLLGISPGSVRSHLARARQRLRKALR